MDGFIEKPANSDFVIYELNTYDLEKHREMSTEERKLYDKILNATIEDFQNKSFWNGIGVSKLALVFEATVESGDIEKFKLIADINLWWNSFDSFKTVILHADYLKKTDAEIKQIVSYLVEEQKIPLKDDYISLAATRSFYEIADYLLEHAAPMRPIDIFDINYDSIPLFKYLEWLLSHGANLEKAFLGKILCHDQLFSWQTRAEFGIEENVDRIVDFLIKAGITTYDKVSETTNKCNIVANVLNQYYNYENDISQYGETVDDLKFALEQGLILNSKMIFNSLNRISPDVAKFLADELKAEGVEPSMYGAEDITEKLELARILPGIIEEQITLEQPTNLLIVAEELLHEFATHCETNKIIAEYAGVDVNSFDWGYCISEA
jgi:hypothetical protein